MKEERSINDPIAWINVTTLDGTLVKSIAATELDHINMKDYLTDVYMAVGQAAQIQEIPL